MFHIETGNGSSRKRVTVAEWTDQSLFGSFYLAQIKKRHKMILKSTNDDFRKSQKMRFLKKMRKNSAESQNSSVFFQSARPVCYHLQFKIIKTMKTEPFSASCLFLHFLNPKSVKWNKTIIPKQLSSLKCTYLG